jgi:hypothetical protein
VFGADQVAGGKQANWLASLEISVQVWPGLVVAEQGVVAAGLQRSAQKTVLVASELSASWQTVPVEQVIVAQLVAVEASGEQTGAAKPVGTAHSRSVPTPARAPWQVAATVPASVGLQVPPTFAAVAHTPAVKPVSPGRSPVLSTQM